MEQRHQDNVGGGGHGGASSRWMISYLDFITLLFVVFVVLYATSRVDVDKYEAFKASIANSSIGAPVTPLPAGGNPINTAPIKPGPDVNSYPGYLYPIDLNNPTMPAPPPPLILADEEEPEPPASKPAAPKPTSPSPAPAPPPDPLQSVREGFQNTNAAAAGSLSVTLQDRGVVVSILTSILFEEGRTDLKPGAPAILDQIASQLRVTSESILVEGAPDASSADAPWDLASRRASTVVGYLVEKHGVAPGRFAVIGYGKGAGTDGIVNVVLVRRQ